MTTLPPPNRDAVCAPTLGELLKRLLLYNWRVGYSQGRYWCMLLDGGLLPEAMCWGDTIAGAVIGALEKVS